MSGATPNATAIPTASKPMRPELRPESSRAAAERRAAEILGNLSVAEESTDRFYVNPAHVPDGWSYEWKRRTLLGQSDPAYDVNLSRTGWEPVPLSRHPEEMPIGWKGETIERDGMILMQRPRIITEQFENSERRKAREQMRDKEAQLRSTPEGQMPRDRPKIDKSYEPMQVPSD